MGMPKKITAAALEQIPVCLDRGLSASEIADVIGCTVGTLRVRCSQLGISLRRRKRKQAAASVKDAAYGALTSKPAGARRQGFRKDDLVPKKSAGFRRRSINKQAAVHQTSVALLLPKVTVARLRKRAALKGMSGSKLAAKLLEVIARDGLYEAVLDEHEASGGGPGDMRPSGRRT